MCLNHIISFLVDICVLSGWSKKAYPPLVSGPRVMGGIVCSELYWELENHFIIAFWFFKIVVNTVLWCLCVWVATEILRWLYSWIFCQDESMWFVYRVKHQVVTIFIYIDVFTDFFFKPTGFVKRVKKGFFKTVRRLPIIKDKVWQDFEWLIL